VLLDLLIMSSSFADSLEMVVLKHQLPTIMLSIAQCLCSHSIAVVGNKQFNVLCESSTVIDLFKVHSFHFWIVLGGLCCSYINNKHV